MASAADNIDSHPTADQSTLVDQVPVIDVDALIRDPAGAEAQEAISKIADACRTWGFFQITNHRIPNSLIESVWQQTEQFFELPLANKLEIVRSQENPWGFFNNELTKNQRDKKELFDFTAKGVDPIYQQSNRWPKDPAPFKRAMTAYYSACTELSLKLLQGFCLGLDLPADFMQEDFAADHTSFARLNYYPVKDPMDGVETEHQSTADLGIHHHTDAGALTLLLQDQMSGLQVYRDGYWYDIPVIEGALVVNTGDMMQVWSNDVYKAAIHRVLAMEERERYSVPFFFNPASNAEVSPLPSVVSEQNPLHYRPIHWGRYRGQRSDGDFADYGTEVQISQYRI